MMDCLELDLPDEAATCALGRALARIARPGDVIALHGDLGMGKSTLARAFIRALTDEAEEVPSPTFTLVQMYEGDAGDIWHFDLYRLEKPEHAYELGIEDAFVDGISLIEWPDKLGGLMPRTRLDATITEGSAAAARRARLCGPGDWAERLKDITL